MLCGRRAAADPKLRNRVLKVKKFRKRGAISHVMPMWLTFRILRSGRSPGHVAFCAGALNKLPHFAGGACNYGANEASASHSIVRKAREGE
jgi:hypothetical protein